MTKKNSSIEKNGLRKGPWSPEEDKKLIDYIDKHGHGKWRTLPNNAGLKRCGKSCRLRWINYLRPDIKRGKFSLEEEEAIVQLHCALGNKWSTIAANLPGRTDNEIKNYWNTHIKKKLMKMGIDPKSHTPRRDVVQLASIINSSLHNSPQFNNQSPFDMGRVPNPNHLQLLNLVTTLLSCQNKNINASNNNNHQNQFNSNDNIDNDNDNVNVNGNLLFQNQLECSQHMHNDSISLQTFQSSQPYSSTQENQCTMELESQLMDTNLENHVSLNATSFSQQNTQPNFWQCLLSDIEQPESYPMNNILENHISCNNEEIPNFNLSSLFTTTPSSSNSINLNSQFPTTSINWPTEGEIDTYDTNLLMYNNISNDLNDFEFL